MVHIFRVQNDIRVLKWRELDPLFGFDQFYEIPTLPEAHLFN